MSSKGLKCPLKLDLVLGVQPVSASDDDLSSPECLLSMQPVEDDYSSDDEARKKDKENSPHPPEIFSFKTYNGSNISVLQLKRHFDLLFYSLPQNPSQDFISTSEILDQIYYFVTKKCDVGAKEIIEHVLNHKKSGVNVLYENDDFQIDLKNTTNLPESREEYNSDFRLACDFLYNMVDMLYLTRKTHAIDLEHHHYTVKTCLDSFCRLLAESIKGSWACVKDLQSTGGTSAATRSADRKQKVTLTARPDLLLTSFIREKPFPGIPFEIYSPMKIKEEVIVKSTSGRRSKSDKNSGSKQISSVDDFTSLSTFTDEDSEKPLTQFLSDNIPVYMCKNAPSGEGRLKAKVVAQHILQILAMAGHYCYDKKKAGGQMQKSKVFIGLFVCDEYIHITKVQGDEGCFAKYVTGEDIETTTNKQTKQHLLQKLHELKSPSDPNIHVQFSPLVLDLTIHNHRLALLLFLDYYISKWDEMEMGVLKSRAG